MSKLYKLIKGFFPKRLPVGVKELDQFCRDIFETYGIPDMRSYRQAIAMHIMNIDQDKCHKSPFWFACSIRKAMANQIAYSLIEECRAIEKKEKEELEAKEKASIEQAQGAEPSVAEPLQN